MAWISNMVKHLSVLLLDSPITHPQADGDKLNFGRTYTTVWLGAKR